MVPSQAPSVRLSDRPSRSPNKSRLRTIQPSAAPSIPPSGAPSSTPAPSSRPFVSNVPTELIFATNSSSSDGFESVCENTLPNTTTGGTTQEQTLAFKYNLYITPLANATDVTLSMETLLHFGMARHFLVCDFSASPSTSSNYYIISIRSNPADTVSDDACDTLNDPIIPNVVDYECVVVNAALSMTAFFPSTRRLQDTDANPDVLAASADYLEDSMGRGDFDGGNIVQVTFQGFVNVKGQQGNDESPGATTAPDGGVAGIIGGQPRQPTNDNSSIAVGATVIGIAAVCLVIVLTIVSVRFRNGRREANLSHFDELSEANSEVSLGEKRTAPLSWEPSPLSWEPWEGKVNIITEEEECDMDSSEDEEHHVAEHDVHNCASATCQVCRTRELQPTFISTAFGTKAIADDLVTVEEEYDTDWPEDEEHVAEHDVCNCASTTCQVCRNRELQPTFRYRELQPNLISTAFGTEAIIADDLVTVEEEYDMDWPEDEEHVAEHDVRNCVSATCQVCRNRELQPTYIYRELQPTLIYTAFGTEAIADLRPRPTVSGLRESWSYITPDTVEL